MIMMVMTAMMMMMMAIMATTMTVIIMIMTTNVLTTMMVMMGMMSEWRRCLFGANEDIEVPATFVPVVQGESWPRRPLVPSYDVEERGGFIWLFYGSRDLPKDERPPIPMMPELEDPNWHPVFGEFEFDAPHWTVFQNAIDMAHIHYLHSDSFGNQEAPDIRGVKEIEHDAWGVTSTFKLTNKPVNALWSFTAVPEVEVTAKALLPSTSVISFTLGAGVSFITFVSTVPIDERRSVNRFALIRNKFSFSGFDSIAVEAMRKIFSEDKAMIEQLRPDLLPQEVSVRADTIQTLHAKLRQEYIDLGYGVFPGGSSSCGTDC